MADQNGFSPAYILGGTIGRLGREELVELARAVCLAVIDCEGEYHGNIHPGNISRDPEGRVALGPRAAHAPGEWTTDELEYMAPELFWNGDGDATVDVYSIGLLLYAGVTGGRLPFFAKAPSEMSNELRAAALRRRMNGEEIRVPAFAGEKLGVLISSALAFDPAERCSGPVELLAALTDCVGEGDAAAMAMFGKPERELTEVERTMAGIIAAGGQDEPEEDPAAPDAPEAETPRGRGIEVPIVKARTPKPKGPKPEYRVDKGFEDRVPKKRKQSKKPILIVLGICAAIVILALIIHAVWPAGEVDPSAPPSAAPTQDVDPVNSSEPTPEATPEPTPEITPEPTPEATPEPTAEPAAESTYELYIEDCTWTEAAEKCRALGGHLVTISDAEELAEVTALAELYGVRLVWIGFYRGPEGIVWVNEETIDYYIWGRGEPSATDTDGTVENYGLLWRTNDQGWIYNDSRNDPVGDYPAVYSGNIAYICEYDG